MLFEFRKRGQRIDLQIHIFDQSMQIKLIKIWIPIKLDIYIETSEKLSKMMSDGCHTSHVKILTTVYVHFKIMGFFNVNVKTTFLTSFPVLVF